MREKDLKAVVGSNERIMWEGRPDKKCFILESIFNPLLPFALIWAFFDFGVLGQSLLEGSGMGAFMIPFFILHLMPVWLYVGGVLFSLRRYKNTYYIITDAAVYISGGIFSYSYQMKPFTDLTGITMHRGIIDQWIGVGDVIFGLNEVYYDNDGEKTANKLQIINIADYQEVYKLVTTLQRDVFSDTMYPNELRPNVNRGYKTGYRNEDNDR